MAHTTTTTTPQQAAMAKLQAAMAAQGAGGSNTVNLAKLVAGRAYTLRELASAVGFVPPVKQGKPRYGALRRALRNHVSNGKLVSATTGGYTTANGTTAGGKAFYMLVD